MIPCKISIVSQFPATRTKPDREHLNAAQLNRRRLRSRKTDHQRRARTPDRPARPTKPWTSTPTRPPPPLPRPPPPHPSPAPPAHAHEPAHLPPLAHALELATLDACFLAPSLAQAHASAGFAGACAAAALLGVSLAGLRRAARAVDAALARAHGRRVAREGPPPPRGRAAAAPRARRPRRGRGGGGTWSGIRAGRWGWTRGGSGRTSRSRCCAPGCT